ncbi:MAG: PAS domain-containing protein [Nostocaceae cyanobacterium]|nr:PAS domain-containing protein [Nostocaceae cyanobacterium]
MQTQKSAINQLERQLQLERIQRVAVQRELQKVKQELASGNYSPASNHNGVPRWQMPLEASGLGLWDWNLVDGQIYYNARWKQMLGYEVEEIVNHPQSFARLVHQEDFPRVMAHLSAYLSGRTETYQAEFRMRCKSGEWKWILDRGQVCDRDKFGNPVRMSGTHTDISNYKAAQASLLLFQQALFNATDAIAIADVELNHVYHNPVFEQLFAYTATEELQAAGGLKTIFTNPQVAAEVLTTILDGRSWVGEVEQISRTGRRMDIFLRANPIKDLNGNLIGMVTVHCDISHSRVVEIALRRSQQKLQQAQRIAQIGNWEFDIPSGKMTWSEELYQIFGIKPTQEPTLNLLLRKIHPDDQESWLQVLKKAMMEGHSSDIEFRIRRQDSEIRYLNCRLEALKNQSGEVIKLVTSAIDITKRKRAEIALQQQIWRERLLGQMQERMRSAWKLEEILPTTVEQVRQFLQADRTLIYRFNSDGSGEIATESVSEGCTPIGEMPTPEKCLIENYIPLYKQGSMGIINDIYDAKISQEDIDFLRKLAVKASLMVPIFQGQDLWGLLIVHHCRASRQWQTSETESLRKLSLQITIAIQQATLFEQAQKENTQRQLAEAREQETAQELELIRRELQNTQTQLVQKEKMASLGQSLAGIAQEINNPVSFIYSNINPISEQAQDIIRLLELYQQYYPHPPAAIATELEFLDVNFLKTDFLKLLWSMRSGAERIKEVVMALRNFSRCDDEKPKKSDLNVGLDSTLMILHHRLKEQTDRPSIQVIKEFADLPLVECYPSELNHVFMHILNNAIDSLEERIKQDYSFTPQIKITSEVINSHLSVVSNKDKQDSGTIKPTRQKVVIRISDNGKGILPHIQKRIFEPFFTTKPVDKATGLGLAISHQIIVEKHQGKLKCNSQLFQGTEFVIEITTKMKSADHVKEHSSFSSN